MGAAQVDGWSTADRALAATAIPIHRNIVSKLRELIGAGEDPLGELFSQLRTSEERRDLGATYTPDSMVRAMLAWAQEKARPARVVDPGVGSARFLMRAASSFPDAQLIGIDVDPLAAIIARGNLAARGLAARSCILLQDYREAKLRSRRQTLFIGNPPYVRHHLIEPKWKDWLTSNASELELESSQLAGLHVHFFLATVL
ncbi:MAG TPA: N-6 DNA methylase, partial [Steroidobacteraceae bacterium]|nr:N-6 DNA methylase [Steroidobacteraceae bacterium]